MARIDCSCYGFGCVLRSLVEINYFRVLSPVINNPPPSRTTCSSLPALRTSSGSPSLCAVRHTQHDTGIPGNQPLHRPSPHYQTGTPSGALSVCYFVCLINHRFLTLICLSVRSWVHSPPSITESSGQGMDQADPNSVHQALNAQDALVGRHKQMLQGLMDTLNNLSTTVNQIGHQVNLLTIQPPAAASYSTTPAAESNSPCMSAAPLSSAPGRELFVPPPEQYSGDVGLCGSFLIQCSHVFDLQPTSYTSDKAKIAYTMNLLRGRVAQWGTALWETGSDALESHDTFVTEMREVFGLAVQGTEAATRLFSLRQGSQSAANYSIDFCIWQPRGCYLTDC